MRLWTLHPHYLDLAGLRALWQNGILAQKNIFAQKGGVELHPQLLRFQKTETPEKAIGTYLLYISEEAEHRGVHFDIKKILVPCRDIVLDETVGQIQYEWWHFLTQLKDRAPTKYEKLQLIQKPDAHPMFRIIPGNVKHWELSSDL